MLTFIILSFFSSAQNINNLSAGNNNINLSAGAQLLFRNVKTKLSIGEKNKIFSDLNLEVSKDKKEFIADGFSIETHVYPTDMNKDSIEEIFVVLSSIPVYGNAGEQFFLYVKNPSGEYQRQPKIDGGVAAFLSTQSFNYNDILIHLQGTKYSVWKWNGQNYIHDKNIKNKELRRMKSTPVSEFSKNYTTTFKN